MPKVNTNLQNTRVNRYNCTNKINNNNTSVNDKTTSELLSGLKAEHIPLPDIQYIKRVLENSRRAKSKKNDPPRPPNAFFLFRNALNSHLAARNLKVPQISMAAGELWSAASEDIKSQYTKLQEIAKVLHLEMHPGYVYRPRKTFTPLPNPNPLNSNHTSRSLVKKNKLEKDVNSTESITTSSSSFTSISDPSTKSVNSRLSQLSIIKHNEIGKLQISPSSLTKPNSSFSFNNNLYENKTTRDFTHEHKDRNQELTGFHIFANNNTPQIYSQQQQIVPTRLIRYLSPVQNHNQQNIGRNFARNHFMPQQQQNQNEPVLITTLTSITTLPVTVSHINSVTPIVTSTQNNMNSPRDISVMTQQSVNSRHYRYNSFNFGGEQGNESFNDWVNWSLM